MVIYEAALQHRQKHCTVDVMSHLNPIDIIKVAYYHFPALTFCSGTSAESKCTKLTVT